MEAMSPELVDAIMSHLDTADLLAARRVSRAWRRLASARGQWLNRAWMVRETLASANEMRAALCALGCGAALAVVRVHGLTDEWLVDPHVRTALGAYDGLRIAHSLGLTGEGLAAAVPALRHMTRLEFVNLRRVHHDAAVHALAEHATALTALYIAGPRPVLTDAALVALAGSRAAHTLREITLCGVAAVRGPGVAALLGACVALERLDLSRSGVDVSAWDGPPPVCTRLARLDLTAARRVCDTSLAHIARALPWLRELALAQVSVTSVGMTALSVMVGLERLVLRHCSRVASIAALRPLRALVALDLGAVNAIDGRELATLLGLRANDGANPLTELVLPRSCAVPPVLGAIARFAAPSLRALSVHVPAPAGPALALALDQCTQLVRLELHGGWLSVRELGRCLGTLRTLTWTASAGGAQAGSLVALLAAAPRLTALSISARLSTRSARASPRKGRAASAAETETCLASDRAPRRVGVADDAGRQAAPLTAFDARAAVAASLSDMGSTSVAASDADVGLEAAGVESGARADAQAGSAGDARAELELTEQTLAAAASTASRLQRLTVCNGSATMAAELETLARFFVSLRSLVVAGTPLAMDALTTLLAVARSSLAELDIGGLNADDTVLESVFALGELRALSLADSRVTDEGVARAAARTPIASRHMSRLDLAGCDGLTNSEQTFALLSRQREPCARDTVQKY